MIDEHEGPNGSVDSELRAVLERIAAGELSEHDSVAAIERLLSPPEEPARTRTDERAEKLAQELLTMAAELLEIDRREIHLHVPMAEYGFTSVMAADFASRVRERFGLVLPPTIFFEHHDLKSLRDALLALLVASPGVAAPGSRPRTVDVAPVAVELPSAPDRAVASSAVNMAPPSPARERGDALEPVAIVGMACRMPGAPDLASFWRHLLAGTDLVGPVPNTRHGEGSYRGKSADLSVGGFLSDVGRFDAEFFGLSPREARLMDPQHRLFLEVAWQAFEDAGIRPSEVAGTRMGVFAGIATADYQDLVVDAGVAVDPFMSTGLAHALLPNRVSWFFDLRGPSEPVNMSCASGLLALSRAMDSIREGTCDSALVGGVNLILHDRIAQAFARAGMLARDGRCRSFSAGAEGFVRGEGVGVVLLKPLARARADGDRIYALLRGGATGHSGHAKSLTAPDLDGWTSVLRQGCERAGVDPSTVGYVEAYGIGAELADRCELAAIQSVYGGASCGIGSVKSNVGSLETASSMAALFKVVLALQSGQLAPTLHLGKPVIALGEGGPFLVDRLRAWPRAAHPRRAAINAFSYGGANAHVLLEEYPQPRASQPSARAHLLPLSARSAVALSALVAHVSAFVEACLARGDLPPLSDIAHTLQRGRESWPYRMVVVALDAHDWLRSLQAWPSAARLDTSTPDAELGELARRWLAGETIDWAAQSLEPAARRVSLPGHPFAGQTHWFDRRQSLNESAWKVDASTPERVSLHSSLSTSLACFREHHVGGSMVLPAAAYSELLFDAGAALGFERSALALQLEFLRPALPEGDASRLTISLQGQDFELLLGSSGTAQARGRFVLGAVDTPSAQLPSAFLREQAAEHRDAGELYARLATAGVELGPTWRPLRELWVGSGWALGRLEQGEATESGARAVLIEGALQLISALARADHASGVVRALGRVVWHRAPTARALAYVVQRGDAYQLQIADEQGATLAQLADVAVRWFAAATGELGPSERAHERDQLGPRLRASLHYTSAMSEAADELALRCAALVRAAFVKAGVDLSRRDEGAARDSLRVVERYRPLFGRLFAALHAPAAEFQGEPSDLIAAHLRLAERTCARLVEVLRGECSPMEVVFPAASLDQVADVYASNGLSDPFNRAAAELVRHFVEPRLRAQPERPLTILEIGAGTGSSARPMLVALEPWASQLRYTCTDVSAGLTRHCKRQLGNRYPCVDVARLDIEHAPSGQGFELASQDVVFAANVLHATREIDRSLSHAAALLRPGGQLVLIEATRPHLFLDVTFGLLDGWWCFEDPEHRLPGCPLASPETWRQRLLANGFAEVHSAVGGFQSVIVAVRDASPACERPEALHQLGPQSRLAERHDAAPTDVRQDAVVAHVIAQLRALIAEALEVAPGAVEPQRPFFEYGLDSFLATELIDRARRRLGVELHVAMLFNHPTLDALGRHVARQFADRLQGTLPAPQPAAMTVGARAGDLRDPVSVVGGGAEVRLEIAVVGMAGRFPGAADLDQFWSNLAAGRCSIDTVPASRWSAEQVYDGDEANLDRSYCVRGGFLEDIDLFDAELFRMTGREAGLTDPQHRVFAEQAWAALEHAGYAEPTLANLRCAVYVGAGSGDYLNELLRVGAEKGAQCFWGNTASVMASRISYALDLKGPSMAIDTACSSSLVAVHLACQSLRSGESDMALAGGVFVQVSSTFHVLASNGRMLSRDGLCRAFDARADGFVPGEGVGVIVLKPLAAAQRDGDTIYGVIKASGTNQDGRTAGITAPSGDAQAELIASTYRRFGIAPSSIDCVEAHGTGTKLGDPVEVEALTRVFQEGCVPGSCALGSVKTNIGHTATAAGIAGVLKGLLMLGHGQVAPSLHFERANEHIDFARGPFYVATSLENWPARERPRRVAVSSFGFGGTNAHLVLEQAPRIVAAPRAQVSELCVFSAMSPGALRALLERFARWIDAREPQPEIIDVAYTLGIGRNQLRVRAAIVADTLSALRGSIAALLADRPDERTFMGPAEGLDPGHDPERLRLARATSELDATDTLSALRELGKLFVEGYAPTWTRVYRGRSPRRIALPTYPFQRRRYWLTPATPLAPSALAMPAAALRAEREPDELHAHPVWLESALDAAPAAQPGVCIVVGEPEIASALASRGWSIAALPSSFDARRSECWEACLEQLASADRALPISVVLGRGRQGSSTEAARPLPAQASVDAQIDHWITPMEALARALLTRRATAARLLLVHHGLRESADPLAPFFEAAAGFARSLRSLLPSVSVRCVLLAPQHDAGQNAVALAHELGANDPEELVAHAEGRRWLSRLEERSVPSSTEWPLPESATTWLISGGFGAIGMRFAEQLASRPGARLVLIGRSAPAEQAQRIAALEALGARVLPAAVDVADRDGMRALMERVHASFGPVHGVIHAAGTITRTILTEKSRETFARTLRPKIHGTLVLDEVTAADPLALFVSFSSAAGRLGDFGQCDYAVANRFLDGFAQQRGLAVAAGQRRGRSLTIDWPLWRAEGMRFGSEREERFFRVSGARFLEPDRGLRSFGRVLAGPADAAQVLVLIGEGAQLRAGLFEAQPTSRVAQTEMQGRERAPFVQRVVEALRGRLAGQFGVALSQLDPERNLGELGLDSLMLSEFAARLSGELGEALRPTIFYHHSDLRSLAEHLVARFGQRLEQGFAPGAPAAPEPTREVEPVRQVVAAGERHERAFAVVGMSASLPGSPDLEQFWANLVSRACALEEVPAERWDFRAVTDRDGRIRPRWGGFLRDVDRFDAQFFKIAPRDAELMDPQHRLLVEHAFRALEDGAQRPSELRGRSVGVFVGAQFTDYRELLQAQGTLAAQATVGNALTMLANRVSYLFDLHGPSETIDTACSSSLVALHRAVTAIASGACESALVGGVSLMLTPSTLIAADELGVLSNSGRCRPFDARADGYVKGEGVGVIYIKPLEAAVAAGDPIHAVIRGISVNHGGKANSLTAPNAAAQRALLVDAYTRAGISCDRVGMLELHGTGTRLGDPVEVEAIREAFAELARARGLTLATGRCGLGSVKANIGHLEPAAGIAGLLKAILAVERGVMPGTPELEQLNPVLELEASPFIVLRESQPWPFLNGPRLAGVSSFGFGGSNAHAIVEQWLEPEPASAALVPRLFLVSAHTPERLSARLSELRQFVAATTREPSGFLRDLALTLASGRDPMRARVALVASTRAEVLSSLDQAIQGPASGLFGAAGPGERGELCELAQTWLNGGSPPVPMEGKRLSIPSYPFAGPRHWFAPRSPAQVTGPAHAALPAASRASVSAPPAPEQAPQRDDAVARDWHARAAAYRGDEVELELDARGVATIVMNDARHRNMFSEALVLGLLSAFARVAELPQVKVVILTSRGPTTAMGGTPGSLVDIAEGRIRYTDLPFLYEGLLTCPVPVIAALAGHAVGAGLVFALYADIAVMAREGMYAANFMSYGFTPGLGATALLPERLGPTLAAELMLTGRSYRGDELERRGAQFNFAAREGVGELATTLAQSLAAKPRRSLELLKRALAAPLLARVRAAVLDEVEMQRESFALSEVRARLGLVAHSAVPAPERERSGWAPAPLTRVQVQLPGKATLGRHVGAALERRRVCLAAKTPGRATASELTATATAAATPAQRTATASARVAAVHTTAAASHVSRDEVEPRLRTLLADVLHIDPAEIDRDAVFQELGIDSINGVEIVRALQREFRIEIDSTLLYDAPTPAALAAVIAGRLSSTPPVVPPRVAPVATDRAQVTRPAPASRASAPPTARSTPAASLVSASAMQGWLTATIARVVHLDVSELEPETSFAEFGIDSISGVEIIRAINRGCALQLDAVVLYDCPNLRALADRLIALGAHIDASPPGLPSSADLPAPPPTAHALERSSVPAQAARGPGDSFHDAVREVVADVIGKALAELPPIIEFSTLGLDSIAVLQIAKSLGQRFALSIDAPELYEHHTSASLADWLRAQRRPTPSPLPADPAPSRSGGARTARVPQESLASQPIAVIGMSGRFAGAENLEQFWRNLERGVCSVTEVPSERGWGTSFYHADPKVQRRSISKWGGFLAGVDRFDPAFFNISHKEAEMMSPEQRLFLEESYRALEDASLSRQRLLDNRCGVFVGVYPGDYPKLAQEHLDAHALTGLSTCVLAARISYFLDLHGPSMAIDTACSSSLVAVDLACESIRSGRCDLAIAGGVFTMLTPDMMIVSSKAGMLSPRGKLAAFARDADGIVLGEGVGVVVLAPLSVAMARGDRIHGVILASGTNQDGKTNGISAPSARSQTALIRETHGRAGVAPDEISYVEAHGTGTQLGDPIELRALDAAFAGRSSALTPVRIGSVKTNIGHTSTASGIASLLKVLLALRHRQLPPSLHHDAPNPLIDFASSAFAVATALEPWSPPAGGRRVAALSSFGFSGTNAHLVVAEAPPRARDGARRAFNMIPLSAPSPTAFERARARLLEFVSAAASDLDLADLARTLGEGRTHYKVRAACVVRDVAQLRTAMSGLAPGALWSSEPATAESGDAPDALLSALGQASAREQSTLLVALARHWLNGSELDWSALFAATDARRGDAPTYAFERRRCWLDDAAPLATVTRSVEFGPGDLHPLIDRRIDDGPGLSRSLKRLERGQPVVADHVVAGRHVFPGVAVLEMVRASLALAPACSVSLERVVWQSPLEVGARPLDVELVISRRVDERRFELCTGSGEQRRVHAHGLVSEAASPAGEPLESIAAILERCRATGESEQVYTRFARHGVQYGESFRGVVRVWGNEQEALAEIAMGPQLDGYGFAPGALDCALQAIAGLCVRADDDVLLMPYAIGRVDLVRAFSGRGHAHLRKTGPHRFHVTLVDAEGRACARLQDVALRALRDPLADFFHVPRWVERSLGNHGQKSAPFNGAVLLLVPRAQRALAAQIKELHASSAGAAAGFTVHEIEAHDSASTLAALVERVFAGAESGTIVHLGGLEGSDALDRDALALRQHEGLWVLFWLVRALSARGLQRAALRIRVLTNDVHPLPPTPRPRPLAAALIGLSKSIAREYPRWDVACVDLAEADLSATGERSLALLAALGEPAIRTGVEVALRASKRFVRELRPLELRAGLAPQFRAQGVYVILGGAGGLGRVVSRHLAEQVGAKLVWIGRSALDETRRAAVQEFAALGSELLVLQADLAERGALAAAFAQVRQRFGEIHGVFHSALVLEDRTLERMDERTLRDVLAPKVEGIVELAAAIGEYAPDFVAFFSSGQAFEGSAGQANYAAATSFADAFAHALRVRGRTPIKIINWGYWGSVGVVAGASYGRRMAELGIGSIEPEQGVDALRRILASNEPQVMAIKLDPGRRAAVDEGVVERASAQTQIGPADLARHFAVTRALNRFTAWALLARARDMGMIDAQGGVCDARDAKVSPAYHRQWRALVATLTEHGLVTGSNGHTRLTSKAENPHARRLLANLNRVRRELIARYPELRPHLELIDVCIEAYPELLTGKRNHMEVLFPRGSLARVQGIYKGDRVLDFHHRLVAESVRTVIAARREAGSGRKLQVVEVGGGTGGTTAFVLAALAEFGAQVRYLFTDVSPGFTAAARDRFGPEYPFVEFGLLDIENFDAFSGAAKGSVDIVIGSNVFHAAGDLGAALRGARQLLNPEGVLVLYEGVAVQAFVTATFGLTPGWWKHDGTGRLDHSPLLSEARWGTLLCESGFAAPTVLGLPGLAAESRTQAVLVGRVNPERPTATRTREPRARAKHTRAAPEPGAADAHAAVMAYVARVMAETLKEDPGALGFDATLEMFGVDSLVAQEINARFEVDLGPLPSTMLFEYPTIRELAAYLVREHKLALARVVDIDAPGATARAADDSAPALQRWIAQLSEVELDAMLAGLAKGAAS